LDCDGTNLPGPFAAWYLRRLYLEDKLRQPGALSICGVPVDLGRVDMPAFIYGSREDHIVPWRSAYASRALLGGPTRFVLGASGHVAGVINPPQKRRRRHWRNDDEPADADAWLDAAQEFCPGSWWPCWSEWLRVFLPAGPARRAPALQQAPWSDRARAGGGYVRQPAS